MWALKPKIMSRERGVNGVFERYSPVGFAGNMLESKLITTDWYIIKKDFDRVKIPGGPKREFLI